MLKVNEEKILNDYNMLITKKESHAKMLKEQLKAFAVGTLGYSEEKTNELIAFAIEKNNGLSADEADKLSFLTTYVEEIIIQEESESVVPFVETEYLNQAENL